MTDDLHQLAAGQRVTGTGDSCDRRVRRLIQHWGGTRPFVHLISWGSRCTCTRKEKLLRVLRIRDIYLDHIEVTVRPLTSDAKVGQKVKGFVTTTRHTGNVCFDAGFSVDVMAPRDSLRKPIEEYQEQDVYELVVTDVRGHYVLVSDKPPQEIAMSVRGNSLKGKAKGCESGSQWPFSEHRFLQRIGHSWNERRKMGACSKGVGSKSEPFWLKLSRIAQNQGSSQLGRWDTTKGPVFLLWHLSFPPWKLWGGDATGVVRGNQA